MGEGKSHLVKYLIKSNKNQLKYGIVFSHTAFNEGNFDYIPKKYIYTSYMPEKLNNLMIIQEQQEKKERCAAFVILDDCVFDSWIYCKYFNRLITQVRHYNVLVIITTQYVNKIPPVIRENAFQVCIFNSDTKRSLSILYESYGQKFTTFEDFKKYILNNTGQHRFIYYNRKENEKEKQYLIMRAPKKIKPFRLEY